MNRIKYINPRTLQTASVKVCQPSYATMTNRPARWGVGHTLPVVGQADEFMAKRGFVRAGLRRRHKAARLALRNLRIQNALTDNAMLVKAP